VFSLHYELGAPLSSVFTPAALAAYRRVARLQWRLLRAERSLGLAWRTLKVRAAARARAPQGGGGGRHSWGGTTHEAAEPRGRAPLPGAFPFETQTPGPNSTNSHVPLLFVSSCQVEVERELPKFRGAARSGLERLLRACLRLRADMAHFASALRTYVTYEVLEGEARVGGGLDMVSERRRRRWSRCRSGGRSRRAGVAAAAAARPNCCLPAAQPPPPLAPCPPPQARGASSRRPPRPRPTWTR
jgi:hypothetical protein